MCGAVADSDTHFENNSSGWTDIETSCNRAAADAAPPRMAAPLPALSHGSELAELQAFLRRLEAGASGDDHTLAAFTARLAPARRRVALGDPAAAAGPLPQRAGPATPSELGGARGRKSAATQRDSVGDCERRAAEPGDGDLYAVITALSRGKRGGGVGHPTAGPTGTSVRPPRGWGGGSRLSASGMRLPVVAAARAAAAQDPAAGAGDDADYGLHAPLHAASSPLPSAYDTIRALRSRAVAPALAVTLPVSRPRLDAAGERGTAPNKRVEDLLGQDASPGPWRVAWSAAIPEAPRQPRRLARVCAAPRPAADAGAQSAAAHIARTRAVYDAPCAPPRCAERPLSPVVDRPAFHVSGAPGPRGGRRSGSLDSCDDAALRAAPERALAQRATARAVRGRDVVLAAVAAMSASLPAEFMFSRQPRGSRQAACVLRALQRIVHAGLSSGWERWRAYVASARAAERATAAATCQRAWRCYAARRELRWRRGVRDDAIADARMRADLVRCVRRM